MIVAFESAARCGSFTAAATELGISQPAVSRHVARVERRLSATLFRRDRRRAELTPAGEELFRSVSTAFAQLSAAVEVVRERTSHLVLAVQPTIAESWFSPRLAELRAALEPSKVQLVIFDHDRDLAMIEHDVSIRFAPDLRSGMQSCQLVEESVFPVAAPELAERLGLDADSSPAELLSGTRLLRIEADGRGWLGWREWFAAGGIDWTPEEGDVVHRAYSVLLHQALAGQGVALGWDTLLGDLIRRGMLVRVGPTVRRPDRAYHLVWGPGVARHDGFRHLREWTRETVQELAREP